MRRKKLWQSLRKKEKRRLLPDKAVLLPRNLTALLLLMKPMWMGYKKTKKSSGKTERQKAVKRLDDLCRQILLIRDQKPDGWFRCVSCRRLLPINVADVGHYISRRYESRRWNLLNVNLQCRSCNGFHNGNLVEYRKSLIAIHGAETIEKLETNYQQSPHYSVFDLELMAIEFRKLLAEYKERREKSI